MSSDGTMAVFSFDIEELEGIAPLSAQEQYLKKFGFVQPPLPEGFSHQSTNASTDSRMTPPPSPGRTSAIAAAHPHDVGFGMANGGPEAVNRLVAKRNTKRCIQSTFAGAVPSAAVPSAAVPPPAPPAQAPPSRMNGRSFHEIAGIIPSRPQSLSAPAPEPFLAQSAFTNPSRGPNDDMNLELGYPSFDDVDMSEVAIESMDTSSAKGKRKADFADERPSKARTLGGDRVREAVPVRILASNSAIPSHGASMVVSAPWHGGIDPAGRLPTVTLLSYLETSAEGSEDILEARNFEDGGEKESLINLCLLTSPRQCSTFGIGIH